MGRKTESESISNRNQVLDSSPDAFSAPRLLAEATGSAVIQIGTAIVTTLSSELTLLGVGLDVAGTWLASRAAIKNRRKVRNLEENPPKVPFPKLIFGAENLVFEQAKMQPKVKEWQEKEQARLDKRIAESKNRERKDKYRLAIYPTLMGLGRAALLVGANVPHTGAFLAAAESVIATIAANPAVLGPALLGAFSNPAGWLLVGAVVASAFASAGFNLLYQRAFTKRLEDVEKPAVDKVAANYFQEYADDKKGRVEATIDTIVGLVQGLRQRRKQHQ